MKAIIIFLSLFLISFSTVAKEVICEPGNGAANFSTFRVQVMGLIPLNNEYKNHHLVKISKKLIPYLNELCASSTTSEDIALKMLGKCQEIVKEIVSREDLQAYSDNCDLGHALANSYLNGAKDQTDKCENKDAISGLGRAIQKSIEKEQVQTNDGSKVNRDAVPK